MKDVPGGAVTVLPKISDPNRGVQDIPRSLQSNYYDTIIKVDRRAIEHMLCKIEAPEGGYPYEEMLKSGEIG